MQPIGALRGRDPRQTALIRRSTLSILPALVVGLLTVLGCSPPDDTADDTAAPVAPDELSTVADPDDGTTDATDGGRGDGDPALGPDLQRVTGTVASGTLRGVLVGPVPTPLTLQVPSRGGGNGAVLTGVAVDGTPANLVWDGGRSLTLEGAGSLALGTDQFRIEGGRVVAVLGDAAHLLAPGSYRLAGPVAVGDGSGLARPSDATSFAAGDSAVLTGSGAAEIALPAVEVLVLGPGALDLAGTFRIQTADATTSSGHVVLPSGSFEVTLRPAGGGLSIDARTDRT